MPQEGIHTQGQGPWHLCARCDRKAKLENELQWQRGLLLCYDCYDKRVLGTYDAEVAQVMATLIDNPDLIPSPKLTNPVIDNGDSDIWI